MGVASVLHLEKGTGMVMKRVKRNLREKGGFLDIGDLNLRELPFFDQGKQVRKSHFFFISQQIARPLHLLELLCVDLHVTARDDQEGFRVGPKGPSHHLP